MTEHTKSDELDLITLFEKIFSFCRNYGRLILLFSIAGIIAALVIYKVSPKQYASTAILHSFTLANSEQIRIIENFSALLEKKEYTELASRFNCDPEMLKQVTMISASEIQKLYIPNNPNGFMVEVLVKDNSVLDTLLKGIVYGLENGDYIKERLATKRANLAQLIEKTKTELLRIDSTKRNIENNIINNKGSSSFIIDISTISGQMIALDEKLVTYQEDLKFTNAVQVFQNFAKFSKPAQPKLFKLIILGLIGGFVTGYIIAMLTYINKRIAMQKR